MPTHHSHNHMQETDVLIPGIPPDRSTIFQLAVFIGAAYDAFSIVEKSPDKPTDQAAINAISSLSPYLDNIQPIWVNEEAGLESKMRLFGFAATSVRNLKSPLTQKNVLVLRGTVTDNESLLSAHGWDAAGQINCLLPTTNPRTSYGLVKKTYFDWYTSATLGNRVSLAQSLKAAVTAVQGKVNLPWYGATHSLGGAILNFGFVDLFSQGIFTTATAPTVVTFGSVAVGDNNWAYAYNSQIPRTIRVANLCDFVPSIRAILGTEPQSNLYTHVGQGYFFVWQKDADWLNHSLRETYTAVFNNPYWAGKVWIDGQTPQYPAQITQMNIGNEVGKGYELLPGF